MTLPTRALVLGLLQLVLAPLVAMLPDSFFRPLAAALLVGGLVSLAVSRRPASGRLLILLVSIPLGFLAFIGPVLVFLGNKGMDMAAPLAVWAGWGACVAGFALAAWLHHDLR